MAGHRSHSISRVGSHTTRRPQSQSRAHTLRSTHATGAHGTHQAHGQQRDRVNVSRDAHEVVGHNKQHRGMSQLSRNFRGTQNGHGYARGTSSASGLRMGSRGERVRQLQNDLLRQNPSLRGKLKANGVYDAQTRRAVAGYKRSHGLGSSGSRIDRRTARRLQGGEANVAGRNRQARGVQAGRNGRRNVGGAQQVEGANARGWSSAQGYRMQAGTAARFQALQQALSREGFSAQITCTTGGRHVSRAHPAGRAIDFRVLHNGQNIRNSPQMAAYSRRVAQIAAEVGFTPNNEYIRGSRYKTGPHMHVSN